MSVKVKFWSFLFLCLSSACFAEEGVRPYELDWAGRIEDDVPPLVDFESKAPENA